MAFSVGSAFLTKYAASIPSLAAGENLFSRYPQLLRGLPRLFLASVVSGAICQAADFQGKAQNHRTAGIAYNNLARYAERVIREKPLQTMATWEIMNSKRDAVEKVVKLPVSNRIQGYARSIVLGEKLERYVPFDWNIWLSKDNTYTIKEWKSKLESRPFSRWDW